MSEQKSQLLIIGSGPAGYTAAIYAARAGLQPIVIAGSVTAGGALMNTTEVENFPGFPEGVMGPELMTKFQEQAEKFGAEVIWDDVTACDLTGAMKTVTTAMEESYSAPAAIIATGSEYRKLGAPGELEFSGKGVSYCATCDGFFFRDQPIVVVGGGDSAVEEALFLSRFGSKVYLVHRRGELRASKIMSERALANPKIELVWNSSVVRVNGNEKVTSVTLQNVETGEERDLPASGVFIAIGADPRTTLFTKQLELDDAGYLVVEGRSSRTNLPGVFAAGDVVDRVYRQAITAAAAGCTAAIDAEHFLTSLPDLH